MYLHEETASERVEVPQGCVNASASERDHHVNVNDHASVNGFALEENDYDHENALKLMIFASGC